MTEESPTVGDGAAEEPEAPVLADLGPFYLGIAGRAYDELLKLRGPATPPTITATGPTSESPHYHHAVTCIVFSAVAVEHELMRLIACRIVLQSGDDRCRRLLLGAWPKRPRIEDMVRFVERATEIESSILADVHSLFKDRNALVHAGYKLSHSRVEGTGPRAWEATVDFPSLKPEIVEIAKRDIQIAGRTIKALRNAMVEQEWRNFRPQGKSA